MDTVLASHRPRIIPTCSSSSVVTLLPAWSTSQTRGLYIETLLQETYCSMGTWTAKYVHMWQAIAKMLSSIYTSCGNLIWLYSGRNISLWASHNYHTSVTCASPWFSSHGTCITIATVAWIWSHYALFMHIQIGDFGMARDLLEDNYYYMHGGPIPVKWTSPEVKYIHHATDNFSFWLSLDSYRYDWPHSRLFISNEKRFPPSFNLVAEGLGKRLVGYVWEFCLLFAIVGP